MPSHAVPDATLAVETGRELDLDAVHDLVAAGALADGPVGAVGLELERHVVDVRDPLRRPAWDRLTAVLDGCVPPAGSRVTLEPGGQVELSSPPGAGVAAAVDGVRRDAAHLDAVLAADGLVLQSTGADPARPSRRTTPLARYRAMEAHFAAVGHRDDGLAMMTSTASLQVNLDAGPAAGWADRLAHVHRLLPALTALAACSPLLAGARRGARSERGGVWQRLEPGRCRAPVPVRGGDPAAAWAEFALAAPLMSVRDARGDLVAVREPATLADWASGRWPGPGRGPGRGHRRGPVAADVEHHLSTLWPPVRLRGFLELRVLDAVPAAWWPGLAAVVATAVDDPRAAGAAAAAAEPVAARAADASRLGTTDPDLARAARGVVAAALSAVPDALRPDVERWADALDAGRGPADLVLDRAATSGPAACLTAEELR